MEEKEELLVKRAKKGDVLAFSELVKRYERYVINLVYRTLGRSEDAEDIAQEAFVKAFLNIKKFKEESKFSTWLSRIVVNLCMDKTREKNNREENLEEGIWLTIPQSSYYGPEETLERMEIQERIREAVTSLPNDLRMVFVLREFEGLSYQEISEMLDIPIGTVESRLYRARMKLKSLLSDLKSIEEVTESNEVQ
ncbi:sigma-70 family RNA polymerase sigma factor [bacterium]|nr:sigma-70 family RNA polymerase sigma factor [bacterium]